MKQGGRKLSVISFTENGRRLSEELQKALAETNGADETGEMEKEKTEADLYTKCRVGTVLTEFPHISYVETSLGDWAKEQMRAGNAMLFIGACGIAVRAVAPYLTDKLHDSPVLVMDEMGYYVIPLLAGHMGGANELAAYLARKTGAEPVITTATDIHGRFAVDLFAKRNGLYLVNKEGIAKVSSKILAGKEITLSVESGHDSRLPGGSSGWKDSGLPEGDGWMDGGGWSGQGGLPGGSGWSGKGGLPDGVRTVPYPPLQAVDVVVTSEAGAFDAALLLRPKEYVIGMGCKRGKEAEEIERFIERKLGELGICTAQIFALSSIEKKRWEQGMTAWCRKERIPFMTYTVEELQEVTGEFRKSSFVMEQVGVDNVCERAALKACGAAGELVIKKCAEDGMTIAVAKRKWQVEFYGESD